MREKSSLYQNMIPRLKSLLSQETDIIAAMATIVCELHHTFTHFHWTGFYRVKHPKTLVIGPYQGSHGCYDSHG